MSGVQPGNCSASHACGRATLKRNFASQQVIKASCSAVAVVASSRAVSAPLRAYRAPRLRAASIHIPAGVTVPGPAAQYAPRATSAGVRARWVAWKAWRSAANSALFQAGGGATRGSVCAVRPMGLTCPQPGSSGFWPVRGAQRPAPAPVPGVGGTGRSASSCAAHASTCAATASPSREAGVPACRASRTLTGAPAYRPASTPPAAIRAARSVFTARRLPCAARSVSFTAIRVRARRRAARGGEGLRSRIRVRTCAATSRGTAAVSGAGVPAGAAFRAACTAGAVAGARNARAGSA